MKATIKWKDTYNNKRYQKTFEVEKNEPNYIVNKARDNAYLGAMDYITTIHCGRYCYEWNGEPNY